MLKMSPFLTFLLYFIFVGFSVYYLTQNKLDEKSRYILIGVLMLPYIFMDQINFFSSEEPTQVKPDLVKIQSEHYSNFEHARTEQPKIVENEKIQNLSVVENQNDKISDKTSEKTFTLEEVQKLLNAVKSTETKKPVVEKFGSMYNDNPQKEYNEDSSFKSQLYKPLGENGNGLTNEWDHDYILLNTDKWGPALNPPPVCKTEKTCPVCPNLTSGYPLMVRDFDSSRRITPPINADLPSMNAETSAGK